MDGDEIWFSAENKCDNNPTIIAKTSHMSKYDNR
jgi:hypothetical protein